MFDLQSILSQIVGRQNMLSGSIADVVNPKKPKSGNQSAASIGSSATPSQDILSNLPAMMGKKKNTELDLSSLLGTLGGM